MKMFIARARTWLWPPFLSSVGWRRDFDDLAAHAMQSAPFWTRIRIFAPFLAAILCLIAAAHLIVSIESIVLRSMLAVPIGVGFTAAWIWSGRLYWATIVRYGGGA